MTFKKRRGINLPYRTQGLIAFTCLNYAELSPDMQAKIKDLCERTGGEHSAALFAILTRDNITIASAAMEYHVSESVLYKLRKEFYESW